MALPGYPANDYQGGEQLLQLLGSFWAAIFQGKGHVRQYLHGSGYQQGQIAINFMETVATLSRFETPVFHDELWHLLTIRQSDVTGFPSVYKNNDLVYGPQPGTVPDRPEGFVQVYNGQDKPGVVQVALPAGLAALSFTLQNFIVRPTKVWVRDLDYEVDAERNSIRFRSDPFNDPLVPKRDVFDADGNKIDVELGLWIFHGQFDLDWLYTHFGYVLGLRLASSQFYKDLLNAFWDMHLLGPSVEQFQIYLSALAGAPLVINPTETVEVVQTESNSKLIVTDSSVYRVPLASNVTVTVGDTVHAGDSLTDAVTLTELSGNAPDYAVLPALALSRAFLSGQYLSELTFRNHTVDLEYEGLDADGKAFVKFEVSGFPGDVDAFWNSVQSKGKEPGNQTLAELLDTRTDPEGQPGPSNLPATVNPLEFLLRNLMGNNLFVIRVRQASFDPRAPGVRMFSYLRGVTPPHTTYVVFVELTAPMDTCALDQAGDSDTPGATDTAGAFYAANPVQDTAYESGSSPGGDVLTYGDVAVSARLYSLTCQ